MRAIRFWPLLAVTLVALPATALADARDYPGRLGDGPRVNHSGRGDFGRNRGDFGRNRGDFGKRHFGNRPIVVVPSTVFVGPDYSYTPPPPIYTPPPVIYTPPAAYYPPAPSYAPASYAPAPPPPPAPAAPPEPRVVEFDSGRYEMRGDGIRDPYVWVWVPKAPSTPPGVPPRPPATVYRWTDEAGVTTLTDDPNKVPAQFRATEIVPR
jgi:hypothetical protein